MKHRKQTSRAPLIRCHPATAAFLGAIRVDDRRPARPVETSGIVVCTNDGARWIWPIEDALHAAILRA